MAKRKFTPLHINATAADLKGNKTIGRYILLPGSDGRAQQIAARFKNLTVKKHPRGHHLYLGNIEANGRKIAVAAISSGMGCPSMEIVLHELVQLGATRFLRVGTAGSLQPQIKTGAIVNAQAAVRDELTTLAYAPIEVPALASLEYIIATVVAATKLNKRIYTGTVHCKSALYAREFGSGPRSQENKAYIKLLQKCGVLASEMETAALFIQTQIYNQAMHKTSGILCGAILGVIAGNPKNFNKSVKAKRLTKDLIDLAIETTKIIAANDI